MMAIGRRRLEPNSGHSSNTNIGGDNNAPIQSVVGEHISHVQQSVSVEGVAANKSVRDLLASFRSDMDQHEAVLENVPVLRAMADQVDTALDAPDTHVSALHGIAKALPLLVAGTVVQQGGVALAHAIGSLLG
jgi:hypothetical protein